MKVKVKVKGFAVPRIECLPDGLCTMRIQVVPDDVHFFVRIGAGHTLHEFNQIVLGPPFAAEVLAKPSVIDQVSLPSVRARLMTNDWAL